MNDTLESKVQEILSLGVDGRVLAECAATAGVADGTRLRSALEERALEEARGFLAAYDALGAALDPMDAELAALAAEAGALRGELDAAVGAVAPLLERAGVLRGEQAEVAAARDACRALGARFQLTAAEERALAGPTVDAALLAALDRATRVRDDARALLQTSQHRLGIAVMTRMSTLVEDALWRLAHWVRARLAAPAADADADAGADADADTDGAVLLAQCLARLRHTEMYGVCLDEVAAARGRPVTQGFVAALTAGTPQTRPIEMHAHDPVRFVGDMLAWLHQAVAAEYEAVSTLLGSDSSDSKDVGYVLRREFEGVCRPFQVRVEQALAQKTATAAVLLRVGGLLAFYRGVVGGLLGADAALTCAIGACEGTAHARLDTVLRAAVHRLDVAPPAPPPDLQPPPAVRQTVALVAELCAAAAGSMTACADRLAAAVQGVVAPLVAALEQAAGAALDETSHSVFLVNCLSSVLAAVAGTPPLAAVADDLRAHLDGHVRSLVTQQAARFLSDCGLAPKLAILSQQQEQQEQAGEEQEQKPLATVLGMEPRAVESAVRAFEAALLDISSRLVQPAVERLLNPRYCAAVRRGVAALVARRYAALHAAVTAPAAGYPEHGARVFHYAPDQVSVMLDV